MRRHLIVLGLGIWTVVGAEPALRSGPAPLRKGLTESVKTELSLLDVVVLDRAGKPVAGLTRDDFDLTIAGHEVPLVAVDAFDGTAEKPSLTLLFDYQHIDPDDRGRAVDMARQSIASGIADGSPVMVGALTGSLRVEQAFSRDDSRVDRTLASMKSDTGLFAASFPHSDEDGFVAGMTSLLDVLGTYPGPKAIVLYSAMKELPLDEQFRQIAAQAAASRCTIYPVNIAGLDPVYTPPPSPAPPPVWADPATLETYQVQRVLAKQVKRTCG